jgi:hypothetical protein
MGHTAQKELGVPDPATLPGAIKFRAPKGSKQNPRYLEVAALRGNPTVRAQAHLPLHQR